MSTQTPGLVNLRSLQHILTLSIYIYKGSVFPNPENSSYVILFDNSTYRCVFPSQPFFRPLLTVIFFPPLSISILSIPQSLRRYLNYTVDNIQFIGTFQSEPLLFRPSPPFNQLCHLYDEQLYVAIFRKLYCFLFLYDQS